MHFVSPEFLFWFELALKMAVTALFVSVATVIAERLGPTIGALVATLPVSAGPVYVFLALDHDTAFISASAVASLALNAATALYLTIYVLLAQRHSIWTSSSLAFTAWLAAALALSLIHWTTWSAFALNVVVFGFCFFIVEPFRLVRMPPTKRPWYDFLVRSTMVALLVGAVVTLSFRIGPAGSGVLAVFPVIYTSIMFILHHRVGGRGDRCRIGERHSRSCRIRRGIADAAPHSLASRLSNGPRVCARRLGCLERRCLRDTAPSSRE